MIALLVAVLARVAGRGVRPLLACAAGLVAALPPMLAGAVLAFLFGRGLERPSQPVVAAAVLAGGFRAGFNAVDVACLAPLLALWLLPRIEGRIVGVNAKNLGPWGAAALTAALVITALWLAARIWYG